MLGPLPALNRGYLVQNCTKEFWPWACFIIPGIYGKPGATYRQRAKHAINCFVFVENNLVAASECSPVEASGIHQRSEQSRERVDNTRENK